MITILILSSFIVLLSVMLLLSMRTTTILNEKFDEMQVQVDESLDVLDECYRKIGQALEIPVMSDEPVIREVLSDIKVAKNSILLVANKIVSFEDDFDEE